ncbi:octopamine receptor [Aplysia californica]|uniref:Octopamine receptor n=1 Tax=Aplysia californica TaxID=6500 RepID=Q9NHF3_APLCA|nr:octopamine receptor [Aplysia californica]AAF37686.1 octopamine receptor [Aplysia californica]
MRPFPARHNLSHTGNFSLSDFDLDLDDPEVNPWAAVALVLRGMAMAAIMVGAIFGNVLVISSVLRFGRLRAITNFFIVSLAFADLLVAILVMPFSASMEISGKWVFGRTMCDIFNANDVLFSTASIIHLCCISMDRYIAILHPLQYESKMTRPRALLMLGVTWVASVLISYIPVYSQLYTTRQNVQALLTDPDSCPFIVNKVYAGVSSSVSFWIPCTIMIFVYIRIFLEARKQEKLIQSSTLYMHYSAARGDQGLAPEPDAQRSERRRMKREHKAAKTLGIIMGAFILCFLPFFSWYVATTMCRDSCPYPPLLGSALFWVGYFNSCLNPVIYAYFNREFRTAFKKLLRLDRVPCEVPYDATTRALNATYGNTHPQYRGSASTALRLSEGAAVRD